MKKLAATRKPSPPRKRPRRLSNVPTRRAYPTRYCGTYRMPVRPFGLLLDRLGQRKNRQAAHVLASFLMRFHAAPMTWGRAFKVQRWILAKHAMLDLTEGRIRGALAALEAVGFLERVEVEGSRFERVPVSAKYPKGIREKAIIFRFGGDFVPLIAAVVRLRQRRQPNLPVCPRRNSFLSLENKKPLIRGHTGKLPRLDLPLAPPPDSSRPKIAPAEADPKLEAAIARLGASMRSS